MVVAVGTGDEIRRARFEQARQPIVPVQLRSGEMTEWIAVIYADNILGQPRVELGEIIRVGPCPPPAVKPIGIKRNIRPLKSIGILGVIKATVDGLSCSLTNSAGKPSYERTVDVVIWSVLKLGNRIPDAPNGEGSAAPPP